MDTFLASLPPNWSDYYTTYYIKAAIQIYGEDLLRQKIVSFIEAKVQSPNSMDGKKKSMPTPIEDSRTIHYNCHPAKLASAPRKTKQQQIDNW